MTRTIEYPMLSRNPHAPETGKPFGAIAFDDLSPEVAPKLSRALITAPIEHRSMR